MTASMSATLVVVVRPIERIWSRRGRTASTWRVTLRPIICERAAHQRDPANARRERRVLDERRGDVRQRPDRLRHVVRSIDGHDIVMPGVAVDDRGGRHAAMQPVVASHGERPVRVVRP